MHLMTNMSILCIVKISQGLPQWLSGKESTCMQEMQETWVLSLGR